MSDQTIYPPDLDDLLTELKTEIFATLNCIQIGKIESYNKTEQQVSVQIQVKRRVAGSETKKYPLLVEVPLIVLQGGGAFLDFPVEAGDYCLVFFNDRDIDNWWLTGNVTEPKTLRKHSLSDGFALVGINPKNSALSLDGSKVILDATGKTVEIKGSHLTLLSGTDFAVRYNELLTAFNQLKTDLDNHIHTNASVGFTLVDSMAGPCTGSVGKPTVGSTADITPAKCDKINLPGVGE